MASYYRSLVKITQRLQQHIWVFLWFAMAISLMVFGLSEHVNLYVSVPQLLADQPRFMNQHFRLGGYVLPGSIRAKGAGIVFDVVSESGLSSSPSAVVTVDFHGQLPTLFQEGKAMVADGRYQHGVFYAKEVLAKHDENYRIPGT